MIYGSSEVKTDAKLEAELLPIVPIIQNFQASSGLQQEAQVQR